MGMMDHITGFVGSWWFLGPWLASSAIGFAAAYLLAHFGVKEGMMNPKEMAGQPSG